MRYFKNINGNKAFFNGIIVKDGKQIVNPTKEQMLDDGWQEYMPSSESYVLTYEERVEQLIREKYSINQELAILRQRETKPDEFAEYFAFCEECKSVAKN
jgi:hypothetical protein